MNFKFLTRTLILALAGCVLTIPALAEWQWLDKDGRKVFSDQPPPIDTPQKNIIKKAEFKADTRSQDVAAGMPALAASAPAVKTSMPKLSGKDKELEAMKKKADMLDETKKQAEVEEFAKSRADNCERAKKAQASLNSGIRIATTNTKGEREYMDDAARSAETKRLQSIAESDCVK
ncbi:MULTISPECIES: DUF4124 domain-containing protein [unclassified Polaromonas]|uniref:DUF4124 domain-containing protein n=1 Tax=unclassified Polaromonas TaxID=2638319 RepID=UPI0018CA1211|nr:MULTISPECIES: DUF4124 domain-containing protein [unclassified Polaromonas]MBG6073631.1 hypothetical protein [Polaromonas sp. CG_9.7]MBG6115590.1 hypothetical protein [Polaromonas sp. CG_9.2]MDH6185043.1 hypothetical protein [Polaromonas sp. CG_23.6]